MLDGLRRLLGSGEPDSGFSAGSLGAQLGVALLSAAVLWPLCRRGLVLSDEGYLLQQALDLLEGHVVYRDMDSFVAPGVWFLLAFLFALAGPSVLASRVLVLVSLVVLCVVGFRIARRLADTGTGLMAVLGLWLFTVWAFPAWTFAFYSPFAVLFALISLERLLSWHQHGRQSDLFVAGFFVALSACFKQNYGVFALAGVLAGYAAMKLERRGHILPELGIAAAGCFAAGMPIVIYLLAHGAMDDAFQSLVVHPFEFSGKHDIPFASISEIFRGDIYTESVERLTYLSYPMLTTPPIWAVQPIRLIHRMHALLYWLPVVVLAVGFVLALRPNCTMRERAPVDCALFAALAVAGMIFLGVLPRADFNHLVNVYQGIVVITPVVLVRGMRRFGPSRAGINRAIAGPAVVIGVAYAAVAIYWYAHLIRILSVPLEGERAGVYVHPLDADKILRMMRAVEKETEPGEPLLTVPDLTMINFLTARPVPSAYYNLYEHHIAFDEGRSVVEGAEAGGVRLVLTGYDNFFSDRVGLLEYAPRLASYLITHFERAYVGGLERYIAYRRRETPLPQHPFTNVLESCQGEHSGDGEIAHHLLFSALYHGDSIVDPMPAEGRETRCRLRVPERGGVLALELGYRRPFQARPASRIAAEIAIEALDGGGEVLLLEQSLPVVVRRALTIEHRYRRVEIDLAEFAGRDVELRFRSRLTGAVQAHPLDYRGFAQVFRDVRLQSEAGGARP